MSAVAAQFAAARAAHLAERLDVADAGYRAVLAVEPDHAQAWHFLGLVLHQWQRREAALDAYARAAALAPAHADTHLLRAMLLRDLGRVSDGLAAVKQALALHPTDAAALNLRGALLLQAGDVANAERSLQRAIALQPGLAEAWHHLGIALHRQRRWDDAVAAYRRAAVLGGDSVQLQHNLALAAEAAGAHDVAVQSHEAALRRAPGHASSLAHLVNLHAMRCEFDAAERATARLDQLLQHKDDSPGGVIEPFVLLFAPLSPAARDEALRRYVTQVQRQAAALPRPVRRPHGSTRLRIGYLSPDFGEHAVGGLVRDLFAAHDRAGFEVFGYSLREHAGHTAARIREGCDTFRAVETWSTPAIATAIADDGIDVLVDLGGYTHGARPAVLALRPAPVQVAWLGFLHTLAAPFVDAVILDDQVAPHAQRHLYKERVLTLPGTLFPGSAYPEPAGVERARFGLPEGRFLYASFNNSYKLDAALLDAWARIAAARPDAAFVIYVPASAEAGLRQAWAQRGLAQERLLLVPKLGLAEHIARAACVDLFLDAFRYQAGATAIASAAAALPTLCLAGTGASARLSVSINAALGMEALVAETVDAYVDTAVALAGDPARLGALRERLVAGRAASGLLTPARTARGLEALYRDLAGRRDS